MLRSDKDSGVDPEFASQYKQLEDNHQLLHWADGLPGRADLEAQARFMNWLNIDPALYSYTDRGRLLQARLDITGKSQRWVSHLYYRTLWNPAWDTFAKYLSELNGLDEAQEEFCTAIVYRKPGDPVTR